MEKIDTPRTSKLTNEQWLEFKTEKIEITNEYDPAQLGIVADFAILLFRRCQQLRSLTGRKIPKILFLTLFLFVGISAMAQQKRYVRPTPYN